MSAAAALYECNHYRAALDYRALESLPPRFPFASSPPRALNGRKKKKTKFPPRDLATCVRCRDAARYGCASYRPSSAVRQRRLPNAQRKWSQIFAPRRRQAVHFEKLKSTLNNNNNSRKKKTIETQLVNERLAQTLNITR